MGIGKNKIIYKESNSLNNIFLTNFLFKISKGHIVFFKGFGMKTHQHLSTNSLFKLNKQAYQESFVIMVMTSLPLHQMFFLTW
jgi:hypothetical protein